MEVPLIKPHEQLKHFLLLSHKLLIAQPLNYKANPASGQSSLGCQVPGNLMSKYSWFLETPQELLKLSISWISLRPNAKNLIFSLPLFVAVL
jgi:hypothetical protein